MLDLTVFADWAQILSLPIAIVATLISIWLYFRSRQRRRIVCEFDPITFPVEIKAGEGLGGNIEIRYQGIPVDNLFLLRVKLRNAGNTPIRRQNIVKPMTFIFDPGTSLILPPQVVNKRPDNLTVAWSLPSSDQDDSRPRGFSMSFDLLNPGDEVMVEFLCTGNPVLPALTARIEGVKELEIVDPTEMKYKQGVVRAGYVIFGAVGSVVASVLMNWLSSLTIPDSSRRIIGWFFVVLILLAGVVFLWLAVVWPVFRWVQYRVSGRRG